MEGEMKETTNQNKKIIENIFEKYIIIQIDNEIIYF